MRVLQVRDLCASYGQVRALRGVNIEVHSAGVVAIIGRNGAGKSTLLKAIFGEVPVTSGSIELFGHEIQNAAPNELVRLGVCFLAEDGRLFPELTVEQNLKLGAYCRSDRKRIEMDLEAVYDWFPALRENNKRMAGQLSGGQQKLLALAQTLMAQPKLLLLDEVCAGLSPAWARQVLSVLRQVRDKRDMAILLVENAFSAVLSIADQWYVMDSGKIAFCAPVAGAPRKDELLKMISWV